MLSHSELWTQVWVKTTNAVPCTAYWSSSVVTFRRGHHMEGTPVLICFSVVHSWGFLLNNDTLSCGQQWRNTCSNQSMQFWSLSGNQWSLPSLCQVWVKIGNALPCTVYWSSPAVAVTSHRLSVGLYERDGLDWNGWQINIFGNSKKIQKKHTNGNRKTKKQSGQFIYFW